MANTKVQDPVSAMKAGLAQSEYIKKPFLHISFYILRKPSSQARVKWTSFKMDSSKCK